MFYICWETTDCKVYCISMHFQFYSHYKLCLIAWPELWLSHAGGQVYLRAMWQFSGGNCSVLNINWHSDQFQQFQVPIRSFLAANLNNQILISFEIKILDKYMYPQNILIYFIEMQLRKCLYEYKWMIMHFHCLSRSL